MFENLQTYYAYLEKDNNLLDENNLTNELKKLEDNTNDTKLKKLISYEIYLNDFDIKGGEIIPQYSNSNGFEYPRFNLFEDYLDYFESRANQINNSKYKAKYNHLLYINNNKNRENATQAVDSYLAYLNAIPFPLIEEKFNLFFTNEFNNLFSLSHTIHYKKEEVLLLLDLILGKQKIDYFSEYLIMDFVLKSIKNNKKGDALFQKFFDVSNKILEDNTDSMSTKYYLEFLILLSNKLKLAPNSYHNKLAEYYLEEVKGDSFAIIGLKSAMDEYKKANNTEKMEEVAVLMEKAKKGINLSQVPFEYTDSDGILQKWHETVDKNTNDLIENCTSSEIFGYIILSKQIFPRAESLTKNNNPESFNYISVTSFDINQNVSKKNPNFLNE
jgi:hypothetical protein